MHAIVGGLDISYLSEGSGPPILLLHGWGSNQQTFDQLSRDLASKYTVLRLDLPGFGGSQPPKESWTLDAYVDFVESFLDKIKTPKLYALIGHSLGGRIAIRAQATHRLSSDKLVLVASHGIAIPRSPRLVAYRIVAKIGKAFLSIFPARVGEKMRHRLYARAGSTDYMNVTPAMKQTFQNIVSQDLRSDAARIDTDSLLIYGENDDTTPVAFGRTFAELMPKARLEVVEDAEHYVHTDQPAKVAKLVKEFL